MPEIEPVENKGFKQEVNYTLECGHVWPSWIFNQRAQWKKVICTTLVENEFAPVSYHYTILEAACEILIHEVRLNWNMRMRSPPYLRVICTLTLNSSDR